MSVDPGAEDPSNVAWSPYAAMWSNPINVIDPSGAFNEYVFDDKKQEYRQISNLGGDEFDVIHQGTFLDDGSITIDPSQTQVVDVMTSVSSTSEMDLRAPGINVLSGASGAIQPTASPVDFIALGAPNVVRATGGFLSRQLAGSNKTGTIYNVPGTHTQSGLPYIGRHNRPNPAKTRRSKDGRDRSKARVIDRYNPDKPGLGQFREQRAIDRVGGIGKLDNRINAATPTRMNILRKKYGKWWRKR